MFTIQIEIQLLLLVISHFLFCHKAAEANKNYSSIQINYYMLHFIKSGVIVALALLFNSISAQIIAPRNKMFSQPLIEVFSGINCNFCDPGDQVLNSMVTANGSCPVNIIEYNAGIDARPANSNQTDLRSSCGDTILGFFNIPATPLAIINRESGSLKIYPEWANAFSFQKNNLTPVNLGMKVDYDSTLRELNILVEIYPLQTENIHSCILNLMLTENRVKGYQKMYGGNENYNYFHNYVFRSPITACFGDTIKSLVPGAPFQVRYLYRLPESVNPDLSRVIGFVTSSIYPVEFYTSESIPVSGGRTFVDGVLSDDQDEEVIVKPGEDIVRELNYQSMAASKQVVQFKFIFDKPDFWDLTVEVDGKQFADTISYEFQPGERKNIQIVFATHGYNGFADFELVITPNSTKSQCPSIPHSKKLKCKPAECGTIVVYNTSKRTDGLPNTVNLWKPITDALDCFLCKDYVILKDFEFERMFTLDTSKVPKAIYYQVGWGIPLVSSTNYAILRRLMDKGTALFMAGQDISYQMGSNLPGSFTNANSRYFHNIYLSAKYVWNGDSTLHHINGITTDPVFGQLKSSDLKPVYNTATTLNLFPDVISSTSANAKTFLSYDDGRICGYYFNRPPHKVIFLGVGVEMIEDMKFRKDLITTAHIWMLGCDKLISGVADLKSSAFAEVYPTCSAGELNVGISILQDRMKMYLYNLNGQLLHVFQIKNGSQVLDLSGLSQGVYLYKLLFAEDKVGQTGKFIKI